MVEAHQTTSVGTDAAARARLAALTAPIVLPLLQMARRTMGAAIVGGLVAGLLTAVTRDPATGLLAGVAATALMDLTIWRPLLDRDQRAAVELIQDHDCHERAEWRAETATNVPLTVPEMTRWLTAHPTGPGRASVLLRLGRLAEAAREIEQIEPTTPEEAFGVEILRQNLNLVAGDRADVAALYATWRSLPDSRERRHRRECLALLDAQVAVAAGEDPIPSIARARKEIGHVHASVRIERILARWALIGLATVLIATAAVSVVVRSEAIFS